jgi:ParB-like chromosome segregation protein Spo0J
MTTWPVARLVPYEKNPRKNDAAVSQMVASITEFGFKVPVLVRSSGEVIDGHLRLKAAHALGIVDVPVILCDEWTDAQVKAFRLVANRSAAWADWDVALVALELSDLSDSGFDLSLTGFDSGELSRYMTEGDTVAPTGFAEYDESVTTEHECPKCGYKFSGGKSSKKA